MDYKGKTAVITGGASGIGETAARMLAKKGVSVVIGDINASEIERVTGEIKKEGCRAIGFVTDVTRDEDVKKLLREAVAFGGSVNIVLPCAGIIRDGLMINTDRETKKVKSVMSTEQFRTVVEVNLVGSFITLREAASLMTDNDWEGVLFVISSINHVGQLGQLNYSSTKCALALWPKILTGEFHMKGISGIRVVGLAPGYVGTPLLTGMNQDALDGILKDVHIRRLIEPEEIVRLILHVLENDALDGTTLEITGGVTFGPRTRAK